MSITELIQQLQDRYKGKASGETVSLPAATLRSAVDALEETADLQKQVQQMRDEMHLKPSVAKKLNEKIRSLESEVEELRTLNKVQELEKKVQRLEVELKQSYQTKNFTLKNSLLDLEKQYRQYIDKNPHMQAMWADVVVLLDEKKEVGQSFLQLGGQLTHTTSMVRRQPPVPRSRPPSSETSPRSSISGDSTPVQQRWKDAAAAALTLPPPSSAAASAGNTRPAAAGPPARQRSVIRHQDSLKDGTSLEDVDVEMLRERFRNHVWLGNGGAEGNHTAATAASRQPAYRTRSELVADVVTFDQQADAVLLEIEQLLAGEDGSSAANGSTSAQQLQTIRTCMMELRKLYLRAADAGAAAVSGAAANDAAPSASHAGQAAGSASVTAAAQDTPSGAPPAQRDCADVSSAAAGSSGSDVSSGGAARTVDSANIVPSMVELFAGFMRDMAQQGRYPAGEPRPGGALRSAASDRSEPQLLSIEQFIEQFGSYVSLHASSMPPAATSTAAGAGIGRPKIVVDDDGNGDAAELSQQGNGASSAGASASAVSVQPGAAPSSAIPPPSPAASLPDETPFAANHHDGARSADVPSSAPGTPTPQQHGSQAASQLPTIQTGAAQAAPQQQPVAPSSDAVTAPAPAAAVAAAAAAAPAATPRGLSQRGMPAPEGAQGASLPALLTEQLHKLSAKHGTALQSSASAAELWHDLLVSLTGLGVGGHVLKELCVPLHHLETAKSRAESEPGGRTAWPATAAASQQHQSSPSPPPQQQQQQEAATGQLLSQQSQPQPAAAGQGGAAVDGELPSAAANLLRDIEAGTAGPAVSPPPPEVTLLEERMPVSPNSEFEALRRYQLELATKLQTYEQLVEHLNRQMKAAIERADEKDTAVEQMQIELTRFAAMYRQIKDENEAITQELITVKVQHAESSNAATAATGLLPSPGGGTALQSESSPAGSEGGGSAVTVRAGRRWFMLRNALPAARATSDPASRSFADVADAAIAARRATADSPSAAATDATSALALSAASFTSATAAGGVSYRRSLGSSLSRRSMPMSHEDGAGSDGWQGSAVDLPDVQSAAAAAAAAGQQGGSRLMRWFNGSIADDAAARTEAQPAASDGEPGLPERENSGPVFRPHVLLPMRSMAKR